jgi:hypothetical protein
VRASLEVGAVGLMTDLILVFEEEVRPEDD